MAQKKRRDAADAGVDVGVSARHGDDEMMCRRWKMALRRLRPRRGDRRRRAREKSNSTKSSTCTHSMIEREPGRGHWSPGYLRVSRLWYTRSRNDVYIF